MANRLSMATIHSVETLHRSGHSRREIARLLGIDRGTVNAYVRRLQAAAGDEGAGPTKPNPQPGADQNQPHLQTGSVQNRPNPQTGSPEPEMGSEAVVMPPGNGAIGDLPVVPSGPPSLCEAYGEMIEEIHSLTAFVGWPWDDGDEFDPHVGVRGWMLRVRDLQGCHPLQRPV